MLFSFSESEGNTILHGSSRFFCFKLGDSPSFVATAVCMHRGGPLNMAEYDAKKRCLICPWHGMKLSIASLRNRSLPAFCVNGIWTVELPEQAKQCEPVIMPSLGNRHH